MEVNVIAFGQIAEITGKTLTVSAHDIEALQAELKERYPELGTKKYALAINKKMVSGNTPLNANDIVALMPPFSGG